MLEGFETQLVSFPNSLPFLTGQAEIVDLSSWVRPPSCRSRRPGPAPLAASAVGRRFRLSVYLWRTEMAEWADHPAVGG